MKPRMRTESKSPPVNDERCPDCDGSGYTCKGACFGKPTCGGSPCPRGCDSEGLMARTVRSIRGDEAKAMENEKDLMKRKNSKGVTLIEIIIVLGTLAVVAAAIVLACGGCGSQRQRVEDTAREFARDLGLEPTAIRCQEHDSDKDGYVSCTFAYADGRTDSFECAGRLSWNSGCRQPKAVAR